MLLSPSNKLFSFLCQSNVFDLIIHRDEKDDDIKHFGGAWTGKEGRCRFKNSKSASAVLRNIVLGAMLNK
jgi:hypothetical protein